MANFSQIKNFTPREFSNPKAMNQQLVNMLDALRDKLGKPIVINSSWRDPEHNAEVGGVAHSSHLQGLAVDVKVTPGAYVFDLVALAIQVGFNGIGINKKNGEATGFVHLENRPFIDRAIWTYS